MKKSTRLIVACLFFSASQTVFAGNENGFYLGASYGESSFDLKYGREGEDSAYKVFGGYNFSILPLFNLAVEASYVDFGTIDEEFDVQHTSIDDEQFVVDGYGFISTTGWNIFGVAGFNFGPVSLFGKLGMASWISRDETKIPDLNSYTSTSTEAGNDPAYGVGAKIQLSSFSLRAEYESFDAGSFGDFNMMSLGLAYTF